MEVWKIKVYILIDICLYISEPKTYIIIEYGHEATPSILGLQIVFLAARRDDYYGGYCRARQEL